MKPAPQIHYDPRLVEEAVFYLAEEDRLSCQCRINGDVTVKTL